MDKLALHLPILPTTTVGSFPKPPGLVKARADYAKGKISATALKAEEEKATAFWMETQEALGIDVLVDGEQYRGDMVAFFAEKMPGFELGDLVRSYGNRYYHKPIILGEVKWPGPMTVEWWKFAQSFTSKPVKGMLTGPYTIMDWSFNEHYPDRQSVCLALAGEIRKEVEALIEAGAKIIQVDEPATSVRPEELPLVIEAMHKVTDGLPAYFITHICYGAFRLIYPRMLDIPVDNFDLEMSNNQLSLLDLFRKNRFSKDISFGVLDVHSHVVEQESAVEDRLRQALEVLDLEQIWVDPDCGLKTRTVEEAREKMRVLVEAAKQFRARYAKSSSQVH
ncbi:MAG: methionine synthase [Acidobacteria bacterium]|nr:methionine synthase [Acidobacteriota bacterium]